MGFSTGFLSGLTLPLLLSLPALLALHRSRTLQSHSLRQSSLTLLSVTDPSILPVAEAPSPTRYPRDPLYDPLEDATGYRGAIEVGYGEGYGDFRLRRAGLVERWKDGWNAEVEGLVRLCQGVRWGVARGAVEERVKGVWEGERRV